MCGNGFSDWDLTETKPFNIIRDKAIPLDIINVDTDQIIPKQFLKMVMKEGYGEFLFYNWRYQDNGTLSTDFVLNDKRYEGRRILLTWDNFGSGSSREHAVWALRDFGVIVLIAPSFADIFYNNCFKNGLLPVQLERQEVEFLFKNSGQEDILVDLNEQKVECRDRSFNFLINGFHKRMLSKGLDEIGLTLELESTIREYETRRGYLSS
jgi:3-isopropylmalate/(R)-2-methylmalate dehydratase small subunit